MAANVSSGGAGKAAPKEGPREGVKEAMVREYRDFMIRNERLEIVTRNRARVIIRPRVTVVRQGYSFNLRCTPMFDTPFLEDQDSTGMGGVRLSALTLEDLTCVTLAERCKGMFLFFHPLRGQLYDITDRVEETRRRTELRKVRSDAMQRYIAAADDEKTLYAAYGILTGGNPYLVSADAVKNAVEDYVVKEPAAALDALSSKTALYRTVFYRAVRQEIIRVEGKEIMMDGSLVARIAADESVEEGFVRFAVSKEGSPVYEVICKRLG